MKNNKRKTKKDKSLEYIKIVLIVVLIILIMFLIVLGVKKILNKINNNKDKNENTEIIETDSNEKEEKKYPEELDKKLKKLNYINEKINYFKTEYIDRYITYKEQNKELSDDKIILYVNIGIDNNFYTNINPSPNQNTNEILLNKYYYVEEDYIPKDLTLINSKYQVGGKKMTKDATDAFNQMAEDANEQGYTIRAVSTYRSYSYQKGLYERYSANDGVEKADTYSARPGHSEHQTGLAVDIDNKSVSYTKFGLTKEFEWMKENAHKYGFILRYTTENEFITGYKNEPWHYRYVGTEIATKMKNENISSYEEYYFLYLDK